MDKNILLPCGFEKAALPQVKTGALRDWNRHLPSRPTLPLEWRKMPCRRLRTTLHL